MYIAALAGALCASLAAAQGQCSLPTTQPSCAKLGDGCHWCTIAHETRGYCTTSSTPCPTLDVQASLAPYVESPSVPALSNYTLSGCGAPLYKQCDSAWGTNPLGTSSNTICKAGCAMSSLAMYLTSRGHKQSPGTLNSWLTTHGGYASGDLLVWSAVDATYGVAYQGQQKVTAAVLAAGIAACHGLIANVRSGSHWVLITGYNGGTTFAVNDPGFSQAAYDLSEMGNIVRYH